MSEETPQEASQAVFDIIRPDPDILISALSKAIEHKNFRNIGTLIFLGAPVNEEIKKFAQQHGILQHLEVALSVAHEQEEPSPTFSP